MEEGGVPTAEGVGTMEACCLLSTDQLLQGQMFVFLFCKSLHKSFKFMSKNLRLKNLFYAYGCFDHVLSVYHVSPGTKVTDCCEPSDGCWE